MHVNRTSAAKPYEFVLEIELQKTYNIHDDSIQIRRTWNKVEVESFLRILRESTNEPCCQANSENNAITDQSRGKSHETKTEPRKCREELDRPAFRAETKRTRVRCDHSGRNRFTKPPDRPRYVTSVVYNYSQLHGRAVENRERALICKITGKLQRVRREPLLDLEPGYLWFGTRSLHGINLPKTVVIVYTERDTRQCLVQFGYWCGFVPCDSWAAVSPLAREFVNRCATKCRAPATVVLGNFWLTEMCNSLADMFFHRWRTFLPKQ